MSDHPEAPRVEFNDDGESMNVEEAVDRFRRILNDHNGHMESLGRDSLSFSLGVRVRPCDCDSSLSGRDEYCVLHGDKA